MKALPRPLNLSDTIKDCTVNPLQLGHRGWSKASRAPVMTCARNVHTFSCVTVLRQWITANIIKSFWHNQQKKSLLLNVKEKSNLSRCAILKSSLAEIYSKVSSVNWHLSLCTLNSRSIDVCLGHLITTFILEGHYSHFKTVIPLKLKCHCQNTIYVYVMLQ